MTIELSPADVDNVLPAVESGLRDYLWLQAHRDSCDVCKDAEYRRRFNRFYRVRRNQSWRNRFYALLESKKGRAVRFGDVLDALHRATGRYEASFASKLVATIDPSMPVIDSKVLQNLKLRLPAYGSKARGQRIKELHRRLVSDFSAFLKTKPGRHLVRSFRRTYPWADITEVKMLDLVLWRTR